MKTKWMVLLLVLGLLFFGLGCLADSVAVEGIGAVAFFPGLTGQPFLGPSPKPCV